MTVLIGSRKYKATLCTNNRFGEGNSNFVLTHNCHQGKFWASGRDLVVRVLDSGRWGRRFDPHTGHGLLLKLRKFRLPRYAPVYSAANE